jgi:ribonuclease HI
MEAVNVKEVTLITDGACMPNPGPGGWSYILRYGQDSKEDSGGTSSTTNNRMEVQAGIEGLKAIKEPCKVLLLTDSQYVLNGLVSLHKWRPRAWLRQTKGIATPIPNSDLWRELDVLAETHIVNGQWVKGHSGDPDNERCNELADAQAILYGGVPRFSKRIT